MPGTYSVAIPKTGGGTPTEIRAKSLQSSRIPENAAPTSVRQPHPSDAPLSYLPPLTERTYAQARRTFAGLFKNKSPDLELKGRVTKLPEQLTRRLLVQFVRDAGLNMPGEVYRARAKAAERQAISADSIPQKIAWLTLAFDGYLSAARFETPSSTRGSQREAGSIAKLLNSIVSTPGEKLFWTGSSEMLRGKADEALATVEEALEHPMPDDLEAASLELVQHLLQIEASVEIESLVGKLNDRYASPQGSKKVAIRARQLGELCPDRAMRLVVIELEAERRLAKLRGGSVTADDANKLVHRAFDKMSEELEVKERYSELEFLPYERSLLVAGNLAAEGRFDEADAELASVIKSGTADQQRQAATLRVETAIRRQPESVNDRLAELYELTPSSEARVLVAGLSAAVSSDSAASLQRLETLIDALGQRGTSARRSAGHRSVVNARIATTSNKDLELPALTLSSDEAFLLADASANRALILTSTGRSKEALSGLRQFSGEDNSPRQRFARGLASLANGDVAAARRDFNWLKSFGKVPGFSKLMQHPELSTVLDEHPIEEVAVLSAAAAAFAKNLLTDSADNYLSAASAYPLASASDVPASRLFDASFTGRDQWGVATLGTYEAHLAMTDSLARGLARGTEEPVSAAVRSLNPSASADMAGMVNGLLSCKTTQRPTRELLAYVLCREALLGATENFEIETQGNAELETFVMEQLALEEHTRALTLGCADIGFIKQIQQVLERHRANQRFDVPRADTLDQLLGHLSAVTSLSKLTKSKKVLKAKDADGTLRVAWREISEAVKTGNLESLKTLKEAQTAIQRLGFKPVTGRPGLYDRHGVWVHLVEQNIGEAQGYDLHVGKLTRGGTFQSRQRLVSVDGLTFEGKHWRYFEKGFERTTARYASAMRRMAGRDTEWRSDMKGVRALIGLGRSFGLPRPEVDGKLASEKFEMGMELHTLSQQASAALKRLEDKGQAPKGVMIMVDGIDAASKTSNGERLMEIFTRAGYEGEWKSFKAPTPEERGQHWLARYNQHRPTEGRVFMCDRSPLGDFAYNTSLKQDDLERMADDFRNWQEDMESQGILVLNFLFYPGVRDGKSKRQKKHPNEPIPDLWRPMFTFGKREGRALAAKEMAMRAEAAGAPQEVQDGLREAGELHPGINDLRSFHDGVLVHGRFRQFADAIETEHRWTIIPTERRHKGRKRFMKFALKRLQPKTDS